MTNNHDQSSMTSVITWIIDDVEASLSNSGIRSYQLSSLGAIIGDKREAMRLCKMISMALRTSLETIHFDETIVVCFGRA